MCIVLVINIYLKKNLAVGGQDSATLYSVRRWRRRKMRISFLCLVKLQDGRSELAGALCHEPELHRRMQLHEEPFWPPRRPCCVAASDWIKFQKCLKEMPSPSPTPIFRMISPSPWSVPMPCGNTPEEGQEQISWRPTLMKNICLTLWGHSLMFNVLYIFVTTHFLKYDSAAGPQCSYS